MVHRVHIFTLDHMFWFIICILYVILTSNIWFNVDIGPVSPDGNVAPGVIG